MIAAWRSLGKAQIGAAERGGRASGSSLLGARRQASSCLKLLVCERNSVLFTEGCVRGCECESVRGAVRGWEGSYLVDPASSHVLVSKIKPCMSKYTPLYGETATGSLNQI